MLPAIIESLKPITQAKIEHLAKSLNPEELTAVLSDWSLWQLPYQALPPGEWRRWIMRCGRGVGKTHTGVRTTNEVARDRKKIKTGEIGIIGRTRGDARHTMVEGPSGILATAPPDFRPLWAPGDGILTWPNGVKGRIFSADKPEGLRGPNFAWVWADEPAHWPNLKGIWWREIEPALRMGWHRCMLTTTPLPDEDLKEIEDKADTVLTRAKTFDNPYLPKEVRDMFKDLYEGTRIGKQELEGEYLEEVEGALWSSEMIDATRVDTAPDLARIVIGVDPAASDNEDSDEHGIVIAGRGYDNHGYTLMDRSLKGSPSAWAKTAVAAFLRFKADRIIAEVNNGGDMVVSTIHSINENIPVHAVHATRGKAIRAEPVVAMWERGRAHMVGHHYELEDQMVTWDPSPTRDGVKRKRIKSPDRMDALVWAFHELFFEDDQPAGDIRAYML